MTESQDHSKNRWRTWWSIIYTIILITKPTVSELRPPESSTELTIVSVASSTSLGRATLLPSASPRPDPAPVKPFLLQEALQELEDLQRLPGADADTKEEDEVTLETEENKNETREALSQDTSESEQVVFLSESSYVPLPSLRSRSPASLSASSISGSGTPGVGAAAEQASPSHDLEWRIPVDSWDREYRRYRYNNTRVQHIEAECQDEYMKIRVGFNGSFSGLVYSAGYAYDPECMYINGSGRDYYEFYIQLNRCGTLGKNTRHDDPRKSPTVNKNFMWNTVTVQYNPLIEEEFDEHFKVTCEYGYDFWKTVTFPFLDVEVATGNPVVFTLQPPECYMEIRTGYGTTGARVAGPVRVGDPLTLIIYMRSKYDGFDIVVNDCFAHNGGTKKIQLIDEYGCPVDDKLISRFRGSWSESGVFETQVFAYMKTFRFTGSPALYIECDVRMCHGRCPTQPCHWRNVKNHRKRSAEEQQQLATTLPPSALSENINLFQSLRVLQEGEDDEDLARNFTSALPDPTKTCLRTSMLTTLLAVGCVLMSLMAGALVAAWRRIRAAAPQQQFETYVHHKGRIK